MMTMAHPVSGMEPPGHPGSTATHHMPPHPHRSWYMDPSAARYSAAAAAAASNPSAHLLHGVDHHLNQVDGVGSAAASGAFFASQEASRYYQMHQAYESAAQGENNKRNQFNANHNLREVIVDLVVIRFGQESQIQCIDCLLSNVRDTSCVRKASDDREFEPKRC